jgi:hypothetical protein
MMLELERFYFLLDPKTHLLDPNHAPGARPPSFLRMTAYAPKSVGRALDTTPVGRVILSGFLKITVVLH